jgi:excisionase family DNA binding protein
MPAAAVKNLHARKGVRSMTDDSLPTVRGHTVADCAKLLRVSPDKIRMWIKSGELSAINTARTRCGRPRFVILPHAIEQFAAARSPAPPPKPVRRKKRTDELDFYPD